MANNLVFSSATYATTNMLPDANEELSAEWARKVMMNTARAAGYWGTLIATNTTVATLGTGYAYWTKFEYLPSVDLWVLEGGTAIGRWTQGYTPVNESGRIVGKRASISSSNGTGTLYLEVYPHPALGWALGPRDNNFDQVASGTWIYRLRGA